MTKMKPEVPVDDDGIAILKGELFWKWKAADTEVRNADLALKLKQAEIAKLLEQYPDVQKALDDRAGLVSKSVQTQNELRAVYKDLEVHLGIDMTNVSIDDQTGRIFILQDGAMAPVIPSKKKKATSGARRSKSAK